MITLFKPCMGEEEIRAVAEVIRSGWIGLGPVTAKFERKFAHYIGSRHCVALNSATSALDMSLKLLNIRDGDEVIVPSMTFVSTAHTVAYNHACPVFADVDRDSRNISFDEVQRRITKRTKAIIPVHYGGRPVDLDLLKQVAGRIPIIEDAAHACGADYRGRKIGSHGNLACFSFQAVKNLAVGDGGAITTDNFEYVERAKRLRWLGINKGTWDRTAKDKSYWWEYCVDEIGQKSHMNDLSASIGLIQLKKLDQMNARRREIKDLYNEGLKGIGEIELPLDDDEAFRSSWHIYSILCSRRDELGAFLQRKGVSTGVHYKPINLHKCYGRRARLPVSESLFASILSLPMYPDLTDSEVHYVIDCLHGYYRKKDVALKYSAALQAYR